MLGQKVTPLDRVGLYVPGGKAAYPSSVLMNAIPAKVAGVRELIMVVPTPGGERNPAGAGGGGARRRRPRVHHRRRAGGRRAGLRHADHAAGGQDRRPRQRLRRRGQAPRVRRRRHRHDRRAVGNPDHLRRHRPTPTGWRWTSSRRPSTTNWRSRSCSARMPPTSSASRSRSTNCCRACRAGGDPRFAGQSRRADPGARPGRGLCDRQPHRAGAPRAVARRRRRPGCDKIHHAGAIFIGPYTSEALGDYCAGPNHVLPTSGSARFSSPLGVYDFQKRTSLIRVLAGGAQTLGRIAATLAKGEGLPAHARSAEYRIES